MHELIPETPLRHGHAISIDMAYSATLANTRGLLSDKEHRRLLDLFSRVGLSMDHHQFDDVVLDKGTAAIMKTRDGKLRAAVPSPLGKCVFLNDVDPAEMSRALRRHKELMKEYPRRGEGLEAYVDASDTGESASNLTEIQAIDIAAKNAGSLNGHANGMEASMTNGHTEVNGVKGLKDMNGINGAHEGLTNGVNGFTNGAKA